MPISPRFVELPDVIGRLFSRAQIERAVYEATGESLDSRFASPNVPAQEAVRRTLDILLLEGTARRLLTYIIAEGIANRGLRRLVIQAYPQVLMDTPRIVDQVDKLVRSINHVIDIVLPNINRPSLETGDTLEPLLQQIQLLFTLKSMHERLHVFYFSIVSYGATLFGTNKTLRLDDLLELYQDAKLTWTAVLQLSRMFNDDFDNRQEVRLRLAQHGRLILRWRRAVAHNETDKVITYLFAIQDLLAEMLPELNIQMFRVAKQVSFSGLLKDWPVDADNSIVDLVNDVHETNSAVIARAIEHQMWQDIESDVSKLSQKLEEAEGIAIMFKRWWVPLNAEIAWIARSHSEAGWSEEFGIESRHISDALAKLESCSDAEFRTRITPLFERYRHLISVQFLRVDATFKADCEALKKVDAPLKKFLMEIGKSNSLVGTGRLNAERGIGDIIRQAMRRARRLG